MPDPQLRAFIHKLNALRRYMEHDVERRPSTNEYLSAEQVDELVEETLAAVDQIQPGAAQQLAKERDYHADRAENYIGLLGDETRARKAAEAKLQALQDRIAELEQEVNRQFDAKCDMRERAQEAEDALQALQDRVRRLEGAILWALGEEGTFSEEPEPLRFGPSMTVRRRYWWRGELRERAGLATLTQPGAASPNSQSQK